jgi:hypothetical protein
MVLPFDLRWPERTERRTSLFLVIVCLVWLPSKRIQHSYVSGEPEPCNSTFEESVAVTLG